MQTTTIEAAIDSLERPDVLAIREELALQEPEAVAVLEDTAGEQLAIEGTSVRQALAALDAVLVELCTLDTPYGQMDDYDSDMFWQSTETNAEVEAAAARHGVSADDVHSRLEAYIPDADTPRESIDRVAHDLSQR